MVQRSLILRGLLAGALGGVLAFVFARIFAEPQIQAAVDYETGRAAAEAALHPGTATEHPELFSRTVQADLGYGVGVVLFGVAMGALFAVAYTVCLGRTGGLRVRTLALLLAGAGLLTIYLVPFLTYPASPPSIGDPDTIGPRSTLYLVMVVCSVAFLGGAVVLGRRLSARLGTWTATLIGGAAFVVAIGIVMALLPSSGQLAANLSAHPGPVTETPQPLTDPAGAIVYPGFPADVLYNFRLYSVLAQVILWTTIGLVFAPLAQRLLRPSGQDTPAPAGRAPATG